MSSRPLSPVRTPPTTPALRTVVRLGALLLAAALTVPASPASPSSPPAAAAGATATATDAARLLAGRAPAVSPVRPMVGERTTFSGRLSPRGKPVRLEVRVGTRWRTVARGRVGAGATYRLATRVHRTATYRVKARGFTSSAVRVRVIGQSVQHSTAAPFVVGLARTVTATPSPRRRGREVALQRRTGTTWTTVVVRRTDSSGVARLPHTGTSAGPGTFRVVGRSFRGSRAVTSAAFAVRTATATELASPGSAPAAESSDPSISADGRWVAFTSEARLKPSDTDDLNDAYLLDRVTGGLTHLLPDANGHTSSPQLSANGRWVAFQSLATNLVAGDTGNYDVFVLDRLTGTVDLVSRTSDGTPGNSNSYLESMSDDGRFIAYASFSSDLVQVLPPADTSRRHAYLHDRVDHVNVGLDRVGAGWADHNVYGIDLSGDGTRVAFTGSDPGLAAGTVDGSAIFASNVSAEGVVSGRVNLTPGLDSSGPHLDRDGHVVAFTIEEDAIASDTDGLADAYVLAGGVYGAGGTLTQARPTGTGASRATSVSASGRHVAVAAKVNAGYDDTNGAVGDVIVFDRATEERVVVSRGGPGASDEGVLSADGSVVAYGSASDGLAPGSNGAYDVFVAVLR